MGCVDCVPVSHLVGVVILCHCLFFLYHTALFDVYLVLRRVLYE
jgi:hypothetical protein